MRSKPPGSADGVPDFVSSGGKDPDRQPLAALYRRGRGRALGATLGELLDDLDARFPGIRFRIIDEQEKVRRHMRFFINGEPVFSLDHPVVPADEVCMVQALSGG